MNTATGPTVVTLTRSGGGWKVGDKQCSSHGTGYSAGCMTCRSLLSVMA